jgi:hypothetical protein
VFGWFSEKRVEREKSAERVLLLLGKAKRESDPEAFVTPLDAALRLQPTLAMLNTVIGKADDLRFSPVEFDSLVSQVTFYEGAGVAGKIGAAVAHDSVAIALVVAAMHMKNNPAHKSEVKQVAIQVVENLNRVAMSY